MSVNEKLMDELHDFFAEHEGGIDGVEEIEFDNDDVELLDRVSKMEVEEVDDKR